MVILNSSKSNLSFPGLTEEATPRQPNWPMPRVSHGYQYTRGSGSNFGLPEDL